MDSALTVNSKLREAIETGARAESNLCWTCGTCDSECPINLAANRLRPRQIVRLANLGLLEDLLCMPEIWYCLTCHHCVEVCPNGVQPAEVIRFIREESLRRQIVKVNMVQRYRQLLGRFQRVRWHATVRSINGGLDSVSEEHGSILQSNCRSPRYPQQHSPSGWSIFAMRPMSIYPCASRAVNAPIAVPYSMRDPSLTPRPQSVW